MLDLQQEGTSWWRNAE